MRAMARPGREQGRFAILAAGSRADLLDVARTDAPQLVASSGAALCRAFRRDPVRDRFRSWW